MSAIVVIVILNSKNHVKNFFSSEQILFSRVTGDNSKAIKAPIRSKKGLHKAIQTSFLFQKAFKAHKSASKIFKFRKYSTHALLQSSVSFQSEFKHVLHLLSVKILEVNRQKINRKLASMMIITKRIMFRFSPRVHPVNCH